MKRILLGFLFATFVLSGTLFCAPLRFIPQTLVQPNGEIVKCYASGDEYYHWLHDKDGYTIVFNKQTKYWVYAERNGEELIATNYVVGNNEPASAGFQKWLMPGKSILQKKYESKKSLKKLNGMNKISSDDLSKGTINNLVIFVRFADQEEFSTSIADYDGVFEGTDSASVSFKNYYESVSYNQLTINSHFFPSPSGNVIVSYKDTYSRNYYRSKDYSDDGYTDTDEGYARLSELQKRAIKYIASQVPSSLNIDSNGDGSIDNIVFMVNGNVDGWNDVLWPIQSSVDFEAQINEKNAGTYNMQFEDALSVSVLCHEMFHTLDAPDLYHYNEDYSNLQPVGRWDLMEEDGNQNMLSYMKYRYGKWIGTIPEITSSGTYTLNPLGGNDTLNICYKINSPNSESEYFMIEYRYQLLPFETNIPSTGVVVYRINTACDGQGNADGLPDEVYIYRPGGSITENGTLEDAGFNQEFNRTAINDNTDPSAFLSDGSTGGLDIYDIEILGETATFKINLSGTDVENDNEVPAEFSLSQNYPNPFNPETIINYQIPNNGFVSLKIYDMLGREVSTLINQYQNAGSYKIAFNGSKLSSGIYFYTINAGTFVQTKKMILIK
jgi:M6 family metalloprotease-like protein